MVDGLADLCDPALLRICCIRQLEKINSIDTADSICLVVYSKVLRYSALKNR